jgi:beta-ureidopropionase / N-carbamoyl-L-amino-acid hydrolase
MSLTEAGKLARRMLDVLARETADLPGVTRVAYGAGEQYAHDLARREGEARGALARVDAAGNLYLTWPGRDESLPAIFIGSHLDSVAHGGNYDGAAGVIAGLATMAELTSNGIVLKRSVTVMATRAEEAVWFPLSYPGSLAALGLLPPLALEACRADSGRTLSAHMLEAGFDPESIRNGVPQIDIDNIEAFVEVHIEQGPRLVAKNCPLGIVTAVNGGFRHLDAAFFGAYGHSGAEPRFARRDAVLGFSDFVQGLEKVWDRLERDGEEATITFGRVESDPTQHGGSRILGEIRFTLDIRSEHERILQRLDVAIQRLCAEIAARRKLRFDLGPSIAWSPARMDKQLVERLMRAANQARLPATLMASGAGHDAAAFAENGVPSVMVFVRNANGSHNPDESLDMVDFEAAVSLLVEFVSSYDS